MEVTFKFYFILYYWISLLLFKTCILLLIKAFDLAMSSPPTSGNYMQSSCMTQSIYPGMSHEEMENLTDSPEPETGGCVPIVSMDKCQTVTILIKNEDQLPGPAVRTSLLYHKLDT